MRRRAAFFFLFLFVSDYLYACASKHQQLDLLSASCYHRQLFLTAGSNRSEFLSLHADLFFDHPLLWRSAPLSRIYENSSFIPADGPPLSSSSFAFLVCGLIGFLALQV